MIRSELPSGDLLPRIDIPTNKLYDLVGPIGGLRFPNPASIANKGWEIAKKGWRLATASLLVGFTPDNIQYNHQDLEAAVRTNISGVIRTADDILVNRAAAAPVLVQPGSNRLLIPWTPRRETPSQFSGETTFYAKETRYDCVNPHVRELPNKSISKWRYFQAAAVYPRYEGGITEANSQTTIDRIKLRTRIAGEMGTWYYGKQGNYTFVTKPIDMSLPYDQYQDMNDMRLEFGNKLWDLIKTYVEPGYRSGLLGFPVLGQIDPGIRRGAFGGAYIGSQNNRNYDVSATILDPSSADKSTLEGYTHLLIAREMGRMEALGTNSDSESIMGPDLYNGRLKAYLPTDIAQICDSYATVTSSNGSHLPAS